LESSIHTPQKRPRVSTSSGSDNHKHHPQDAEAAQPHGFKEVVEDNKESGDQTTCSQRTREELTSLIERRFSTGSAKDEKLGTRLIVEKAL
jgi:hypothetical protein